MDRVFSNTQTISIEDLREGGMLLVDKPLEWTSFDVVNKLRYTIRHKLGQKRYKIGHAGTLDPLATGLLLLCFSKYTKKIESLMTHHKSYSGTIRLWATTPCYDAELPIDEYYPCTEFEHHSCKQLLNSLRDRLSRCHQYFLPLRKMVFHCISWPAKERKPISSLVILPFIHLTCWVKSCQSYLFMRVVVKALISDHWLMTLAPCWIMALTWAVYADIPLVSII